MTKVKLVYILSQRYSGSTLLSFLLGTHPDIATIGERRKFFTHSFNESGNMTPNCSCGKAFPDCKHWNGIKTNLLKRVDKKDYLTNPTEFRFSNGKLRQKLSSELFKLSLTSRMSWLQIPIKSKLKSFEKFNQYLVEESLKLEDAKVFLDSSKVIDHILFLSLIKAFDIRVVWLTRDPRAQVNSAVKYNRWTAEEATRHWKREMEQNEYWLKKLGMNYTSLNYEALCHAPQVEMERLLDFLNLDSNLFSLDFREQTQHIMGNHNMRLGAETKITERKEWQTELTPEQRAIIEEMTTGYKQYYSKSL